MAGGIEGWHFLDVESGVLPDESAPSILPSGGRGRIVVLAATPFARTEGWASRAGVFIAEEWARGGLRIFLMDLALDDPSLHEVLDLPNGEGVSDAFLFGASVQHIAKPALNNTIFFAPAGATLGDPEEILGHPRWNDLAGGFSEADATLLLFLPTDIAGAGKILSRATDIVFLAARGESADDHLGPASIKVVTTLGPLGTPPEEPQVPVSPEVPLEAGLEPAEEASDGELEGLEEELESSDFDFEGGLKLAAGFGIEPPEEESVPGGEGMEEGISLEADVEVAEGVDDGTSPTEEAGPASGEGPAPEGAASDAGEGIVAEEDEETESAFGEDLIMGTSLADGRSAGTEEADETEPVRSGAPDFASDFVDLPPADKPVESDGGEGQFGGDLIQGPDFGAPATTESPDGPIETQRPEALSPEARPKPPEEAPAPERRRPPRRKPPKKKIPWGAIAGVGLALAILGSAIGTALDYIDVPGFAFLRDAFSEIPDPPLTLAGPEANEEVLRYSLVLFTYGEEGLNDALSMLDALRARLPDLLLTLVPGEADGEPIHTLLAGPAFDRVEAENLRGPIAEVLTREEPASWSVRETPRAFYLGERGTLREAQDYLASVTPGDLHAYILHVTFPDPDGSESYQILTGAFAGVHDARPLQLILRDLGFRDAPLIERRGRLPE